MPKKDRKGERHTFEEFENRPNIDQGRSSLMHMTADLIPSFNGQDKTYPVTSWIRDVEDNAEIFGWTPLQQLLVARRAINGTAGLWLKSERPYKQWEDLKAALSNEFPDKIDVKTIHELMSTRKKRREESYIDYMLTIKELGKRGNLPDEVTIKYIVDGIIDQEVNKVILYGATTYSELKEKLKIYETIKDKMIKMDSSHQRRKISHNVKCFNCGESEHMSEDCPQKKQGRKCFNCNNYGHIASACPEKKMTESTRANWASSSSFNDGQRRNIGTTYAKQSSQHTPSTKQTLFGQTKNVITNETQDGSTSDYEIDGSQGDVDNTAVGSTDKSENDSHRCQMDVNKHLSHTQQKKMSDKPIKFVKICENTTNALIDSGSDVNLISAEFYRELNNVKCNENNNITLSGLGLSKVQSLGLLTTSIEIDGKNYDDVMFYVIPRDSMPFNLILGHEFLKNIVTVISGGSVWMKPYDDEWLSQLNCFSGSVDMGHVSNPLIKENVMQMVETYQPNQTKEAPIELKIIVKDDIPVAQRPRRISLKEQAVVEKQVEEWLAQGIIRVPLFHVFGVNITICASLHHGATMVLPSLGYSPIHSAEAILSEKCTVIHGTPTMYIDLLKIQQEKGFEFLTPQVAVSGGSPCSPHLFTQMSKKLKVKSVKSVFGMTEGTAVSFQSMPGEGMDKATRTVGQLHEHLEAKVVDVNGNIVPFGVPGELQIRGYATMLEYWNDTKKTQDTIGADKWLRTGDQFALAEDGYGTIVGRIKDMIIRGGENIYPKEIEDFLNTHPDILECHVFGVEDERLGEEVCAAIRIRGGSTTLNQSMIKAYCDTKISHFKIPKLVKVVESFPKTASGKIQKFKLKQLAESGKL